MAGASAARLVESPARGTRGIVGSLVTWLLVAGACLVLLSGCGGVPPVVTSSTRKVAVSSASTTVTSSAAATTPQPTTETARAEVLPPVEPRVVEHGPRDRKRVALTFDLCERDGDTAGFDQGIVDVLVGRQAPATFFMGGMWAESNPGPAKLLGGETLFEIANHSYSHEHMTKIPAAEVRQEILRGQDGVARLSGRTPRLFRFPYGEHDAATVKAAGDAGLVSVQWDVVTGDPDKNAHAADIMSEVRTHTQNGSIIIMHANGRGWHTAEALPGMIDWLRERGYELVTVSELVGR